MIGRDADLPDNRRWVRAGLALLRVALFFVLLCWLLLQIGLQIRSMRQQGVGFGRVTTSPLALPFIGVTVALDAYTPDEQRAALERLSDNGIGWVRQRFDWAVLEPSSGIYDWQASDAMLAAIGEAGLVPVVLLDGSPVWARAEKDRPPTDNPYAPPADLQTFARFSAAFAHRYGTQVDFYQIWNEPNIAPHWGNRHIEPVHYAHLLIEAGEAIHSQDDHAAIIAAALAPTVDRGHEAIDEVTYLQRLYAAGIQPHVDAVAIQPFGFGRSADDPAQRREVLNYQRAAWVRRAMLAAGDGETPLLVTGFGWNTRPASPWRTVSPADQQAYLGDALEIGWRQWPWLAGLSWAIDRPAVPVEQPIWGFTLDDELLNVIERWTAGPRTDHNSSSANAPWKLILLLAALAVVAWRGGSALRQLPWREWREGYCGWPAWARVGSWTVLIVLYYLTIWPPFIALLLIFAAILIAMRPYIGLWLAALLLPFHFQHKALHLVNGTLFISPAQTVILATLPALVIRVNSLCRQDRLSRPWSHLRPLDWFGLVWLLLGLLASLNVWHWPGYVGGLADLVFAPLLLYTMLRLLGTARWHLTVTALALFVGGVTVAMIGLIQWTLGGGTEADAVRRLVGPYFSPNHTALYLERTLFLGMGIWLVGHAAERQNTLATRYTLWVQKALIVALGIVATALLFTASRGALFLGVPVGLIVFVWLAGNGSAGRLRRSGWLAGAALLGAMVAVLAFWPRISNTATLIERMAVWQTSLRFWREFPVIGAGPGGFYWRYPAFIPPGSPLDPNLRHPHNVWLEHGALWGALGLAWLIALLAWVVGRVGSERKMLRLIAGGGIAIGLLAGLAAGLAHGQVDAFGVLADLAAWNWLALGLWRALVRNANGPPVS